PGQSTNTLVNFLPFCAANPHLASLVPMLQLGRDEDDQGLDNRFTAPSYRVVHFVVDMPLRVPEALLVESPPAAWALGRVISVQTEFQIIDQQTDSRNENGDASHDAYKDRQRQAVMRRLEVGGMPRKARGES